MMVLLTRLPTIGTRPHKNVAAMINAPCGSCTDNTKMAVRIVLIKEIRICAPMTVAKLL